MSKVREIIRLKEDAGMSIRRIARALAVSRPVVTQYLRQAEFAGLRWADVEGMGDDELLERLRESETRRHDPRYAVLMKLMPGMVGQLGKKTGKMGVVTRQLLWEEYVAGHPDGYGYSQFCLHLSVYTGDTEIAMHLDHVPGERMFLDFVGDRPFLTDPKTGGRTPVELYVAVFPASGLIYVEATVSQDTRHTIECTKHAFEYAGGAPAILVPDNLKAAVTTPNRYEPTINLSFEAFARYYGSVVIPARVRKPKDKALVEAAVRLVYTRILAALRDGAFATVDELNAALWERLDLLNARPMRKIGISRRERFDSIEAAHLRVLPVEPYEIRLYTNPITVGKNYHVYFSVDRHYYSVPARYRGLKVRIGYTATEVEVYHQNLRIAFHRRERGPNGYTTERDHMPEKHRLYGGLGEERLVSWAADIGPETRKCIEAVLAAREVPQQAFRTCMGILNLRKKFSGERLEAACRCTNGIGVPTYRNLKRILDRGLDATAPEEEDGAGSMPLHGNIRGAASYGTRGARI